MSEIVSFSENLNAGPMGLLQLADVFQRGGYVKLAGSMRRWADELAVARSKPGATVVYQGIAWDRIPEGAEVYFTWKGSEGRLEPGRYALMRLQESGA